MTSVLAAPATGHGGGVGGAARPRAYSVWVDPSDKVWLTDFPANAIVRFDPATERFLSFPSDRAGANVRQMDGIAGEAWGGESGTDRMVRIEYGL